MVSRPLFPLMALLAIAGFATSCAPVESYSMSSGHDVVQPALGSRSVPIIVSRGLRFRDLNRDGQLTPYEDWRLAPEQRAADLVSRMTIEEKASAMMHPVMTKADQVTRQFISSVLTRSNKKPAGLAEDNNSFQEAAESTRLAIPVTISTAIPGMASWPRSA